MVQQQNFRAEENMKNIVHLHPREDLPDAQAVCSLIV